MKLILSSYDWSDYHFTPEQVKFGKALMKWLAYDNILSSTKFYQYRTELIKLWPNVHRGTYNYPVYRAHVLTVDQLIELGNGKSVSLELSDYSSWTPYDEVAKEFMSYDMRRIKKGQGIPVLLKCKLRGKGFFVSNAAEWFKEEEPDIEDEFFEEFSAAENEHEIIFQPQTITITSENVKARVL